MRIFLSYRRSDSAAWAGRLSDSLAARFGEQNIFQDVLTVRPGEDFSDAIDRALAQSEVALVVIGPTWLTIAEPDGTRRLDQPNDHVRSEVEAALSRHLRVIPVLVGDAAMPTATQLPVGLEELAQRQAVALRDATWRQDLDALVESLRGEQPAARRSWLLAAGLGALVVIALAVTALVLRDDDGSDDDGTDDDSSLTGCPGSVPADWTPVDLSGAASASVDGPDGAWAFAVEEGFQGPESGRWGVLLAIQASNETTPEMNHDGGIYELVVDGVEFDPWCFDIVAGNDSLEPGSSNDAVIGFDEVTRDPSTSSLALDVDLGGPPVRIELNRDDSAGQ